MSKSNCKLAAVKCQVAIDSVESATEAAAAVARNEIAELSSAAAERGRIAGVVAPFIRAKAARRILKVIGKNGEPKGAITDVDMLSSLAKRAEIEVAVVEGQRPERIICADCGVPTDVPPDGPVPSNCQRCAVRGAKKRIARVAKANGFSEEWVSTVRREVFGEDA